MIMEILKRYIILFMLLVSSSVVFAQEDGDVAAPQQGFKGFVEFSCGKGMGFNGTGRSTLSGIYGYQFNHTLFAGAGFGYDFKNKIKLLYADARATMNMKVSPFAELKLGANLDDSRLYVSPAVGCRWGLDNGMALNFAIALDYTKTTHRDIVPNILYDGQNIRDVYMSSVTSMTDNYSICLKASVEF